MKQSGLKSQAHVKDPRYTQLICKRFCSFYKPGKNRLACGTYEFIRRNLTPVELEAVVEGISGDAANGLKGGAASSGIVGAASSDKGADGLNAVCEVCSFYAGGCDFVKKGSETPCGGYKILSRYSSTQNHRL